MAAKKANGKQKAKEMEGWKIKSLADAFAPRPPREWAVDSLFAFSTLNIVFGVEGCMKSLLMMDMALCVSEGLPWLMYGDNSGYKFETKQCNVLYVDCDNGSLTDDERINAFAVSHGLTADEKSSFKYISMPDDFDVSDQATIDKMVIVASALDARVLVLDNLGLINSKDENSPEMARVMANLRKLANRGMCVIVVHHQRKSNGGQPVRLGETLRGHSSIGAALDFSYFISRKDATDSNIIVTPSKCRFAPVKPFGAEFKYTWIGETKELETAMFLCHDIVDDMEKAIGLIPMVLGSVSEMTQTELTRELMKAGVSQRSAKDAIAGGVKNGLIGSRRGAHNATFLSHAESGATKKLISRIVEIARK